MTFDMSDILRSKQEYRLKLAALPIEEKLRLLDQLRERHLTIAASRPAQSRSQDSYGSDASPAFDPGRGHSP